MKVVIVKEIDEMPTDCDSCPFQDFSQNCGILGEYTLLNYWMEDAPYYDLVGKGDCPLRPLPKGITNYEVRVSCDYDANYAEGWNDCLNKIIGDNEDEV